MVLYVLWHAYHKLLLVLWDFYASGMQDADVTKSLYRHLFHVPKVSAHESFH